MGFALLGEAALAVIIEDGRELGSVVQAGWG
jgi:hypothetical protein